MRSRDRKWLDSGEAADEFGVMRPHKGGRSRVAVVVVACCTTSDGWPRVADLWADPVAGMYLEPRTYIAPGRGLVPLVDADTATCPACGSTHPGVDDAVQRAVAEGRRQATVGSP